MKTLHSLMPQMPYNHIGPLTRQDWRNTLRGSERGVILDLWIENDQPVALWAHLASNKRFIIDMSSEYTVKGSNEYNSVGGEGFRDDVRFYRGRTRNKEPVDWYGADMYTMETRPQTTFDMLETEGVANVEEIGELEYDDPDDDFDDEPDEPFQ